MSKSGIYFIKNVITEEYYVGQSMDVDTRIKTHFHSLATNKHTNKQLQESVNTYGISNFTFEICVYAPMRSLNSLEKYYTNKYDSINNGFNNYHRGVNRESFSNSKMEYIRIKSEVKDRLSQIGNCGDTYNSIIEKLLKMYDEKVMLDNYK